MGRGNTDEALQHFREALRLDPLNAEAHYNVGSVLRSRGDLREAIAQFRQALQLRDDWVPAVASLAWLLATAPDAALRDANQAVRFAEQSADLTGRQDASALDVLAAAYAAAGQFDRAVATAEAALRLKPDAALAAAIRRRQELYGRHEAYLSR